MIGAAAMSLSSFTVCMNALRLNLFDMHEASRDRPRRHASPQSRAAARQPDTAVSCACEEAPAGAAEAQPTATVRIEGMMCEHCEAAIKKALEKLDFIASATASHEAGTAVVTLSGPLDEEAVRQAVEGEDYVYLGIEKE